MSAVLAANVTNRAEPLPKADLGDQGHDRRTALERRSDVVLDREQGQADEQDAEQDGHRGHRVGRVLRLPAA